MEITELASKWTEEKNKLSARIDAAIMLEADINEIINYGLEHGLKITVGISELADSTVPAVAAKDSATPPSIDVPAGASSSSGYAAPARRPKRKKRRESKERRELSIIEFKDKIATAIKSIVQGEGKFNPSKVRIENGWDSSETGFIFRLIANAPHPFTLLTAVSTPSTVRFVINDRTKAVRKSYLERKKREAAVTATWLQDVGTGYGDMLCGYRPTISLSEKMKHIYAEADSLCSKKKITVSPEVLAIESSELPAFTKLFQSTGVQVKFVNRGQKPDKEEAEEAKVTTNPATTGVELLAEPD